MTRIGTIGLAGVAILLGACGSVETCEEPQFYESAVGGQRIEAPDDLDGLAAGRELVIPDASPRPRRAPGSGCVDRPPTLSDGPTEETDS
jgi:hypothetical protein